MIGAAYSAPVVYSVPTTLYSKTYLHENPREHSPNIIAEREEYGNGH